MTNATNALRAHLLAFRQANPAPHLPEHLDEIQAATDRLAAISTAAGDPQSRRQSGPV